MTSIDGFLDKLADAEGDKVSFMNKKERFFEMLK